MSRVFSAKINDKEIIKYLQKVEKHLKDLSPVMKYARVLLKNYINENFETQGVSLGEKWKQWSESWKKQRIKLGKSTGKILTLDGDLRRSLTAQSGKDFALVGTNSDYAAIHNFGGTSTLKRNKTMPKREFMALSEAQKDDLYSEIFLFIDDLLEKEKIKIIKEGLQ